MKIPEQPPLLAEKMRVITETQNTETMGEWLSLLVKTTIKPCDSKGRYLHWAKLKHLTPPKGYDSELYWFATKIARDKISKPLPFMDKEGKEFTYCQAGSVIKDMLWISEHSKGAVAADPKITDENNRNLFNILSHRRVYQLQPTRRCIHNKTRRQGNAQDR